MVYALVEGLIGVVDDGTLYDQVRLAPRWPAAGVDQAATTVVYPDSGGYVSYRYAHDPANHRLHLDLTGSGRMCKLHVLLPVGSAAVESVACDNTAVPFSLSVIEQTHYVDFAADLPGPHRISIHYRA
jgi:hypothetical protein